MKSTEKVLQDLIETLEDGRKGFGDGAEKLAESDRPEWAQQFRRFADQRAAFAGELRDVAAGNGLVLDEDGSMLGALHRGWMSLKDALTGDDPSGVLDAAEQGEDHAKSEYADALEESDVPAGIRAVIERQYGEIQRAHDTVKALRDTVS